MNPSSIPRRSVDITISRHNCHKQHKFSQIRRYLANFDPGLRRTTRWMEWTAFPDAEGIYSAAPTTTRARAATTASAAFARPPCCSSAAGQDDGRGRPPGRTEAMEAWTKKMRHGDRLPRRVRVLRLTDRPLGAPPRRARAWINFWRR